MLKSVLILVLVVVMASIGSSSQARRLNCLLLTEQFPGGDPAFTNTLKSSLAGQGFAVKPLGAQDLVQTLSDKSDMSSQLLILPNSACFPWDAVPALKQYLSAGGNLFTIGGPPFSDMVMNLDGKWLTQKLLMDKLEATPATETVLDFVQYKPSPSYRDTGTPETHPVIGTEPSGVAGAGTAMKVSLESCRYWEFQDIPLTKLPSEGNTVTTFWAKGDSNTRKLTVAWIDSDDTRWNLRIDLTTEWKRYALTADMFAHWHGKGGDDDKIDMSKVVKFKIGFENHNLRDLNQKATFWISDVRLMSNPAGNPKFGQPLIETLSPWYKTYTTTAASYVPTFGSYEETGQPVMTGPMQTVCSLPRYRGLGFNKTAPHRWIPALAVKMADGHIGGAAASLYVQDDDEYKGCVWASYGLDDAKVLSAKRDAVAGEVASLVKRIDGGLYLLSAGVDKASYFDGQPIAGAVVMNLGGNTGGVEIKCAVTADPKYAPKQKGIEFSAGKAFAITGKRTICELGPVKGLKPGFYVITTSMYRDGKLADQIREPFSIIESKPVDKSDLVTIKGDQFIYKGKPWYSLGINYRPLYVASMENGPFWEHWCHPNQYDAEIVETELSLMNKIGLNTVALIYENPDKVTPAFVDFMERAHRHGIKCHVYIAGTEPMWPHYDKAKALIEAARLWERPAMFAYDLGWEVRVGDEAKRQGADNNWKRWIVDNYGSVENAEKDWGFELRKNADGRVHGPMDSQLMEDGPWRTMVAAYRRFWDDRLNRRYMETERFMRKMDPNHPISVRSGFGGTGTSASYAIPQMPMDLFSGAKHLDYISPEGYNFSGDWQSFREGGFTTLYGKFASAGKPVYWAELGSSASMQPNPETLEFQREYYEKIYKVFHETRSAGSAAWWWPGILIWENSDFSIINPDFTIRPSGLEFTKMSQVAAKPYPDKKPDTWIDIDRDKYVNGYAGMLADKRAEYGKAVSEGKTVGLRTPGTGMDTSSFPRIAVGDTPLDGQKPPKYLNAEFNSLEIKGATGKWISAADGKKVNVKAGQPVYARALLGNIAEVKWLAPTGDGRHGAYLSAEIGNLHVNSPITKDTPFFGDAEVAQFKLTDGISAETKVGFRMMTGDTPFGEKWFVTLVPVL